MQRQLNIVVGVIGAFVAGLVLNPLGVDANSGGYWFTFFVALGGAVVLLWLVKPVRRWVGCWLRSGPSLPSDDRGAAAGLGAGQDRLGRPGWRSWLRR